MNRYMVTIIREVEVEAENEEAAIEIAVDLGDRFSVVDVTAQLVKTSDVDEA